MENTFDNGVLTIVLEGKVDTSNAAEVEKDIFALVDGNKPQGIVIDAQKLKYISSVGLRVVLKLKKLFNDTKVIDTSQEVYEIFDVTGFTDIIEVKKAIREVSVEGCEIIGRGGHGTVYRLDGDTIVKLYGEKEPLDEIEREISYSKKAFVYGIPTAISFDIVKCKSCYGVVFELINADTLSNRLCADPEKFDEYSEKYSSIVRTLHKTKADTSIFSNIKELYSKWADDMLAFYTPEEVAVLHEVINSVPDRDTFIHGDIHPKNIMVQDGELMFIDMADLTYGHPVFDYAGIALTHIMGAAHTKAVLGIDSDTANVLYNNMIKSNFPDRTDEDLEKVKKVIMGYAGIKYAIAPAVNKNMDSELIKSIISRVKESILPNAKSLIGAIDF